MKGWQLVESAIIGLSRSSQPRSGTLDNKMVGLLAGIGFILIGALLMWVGLNEMPDNVEWPHTIIGFALLLIGGGIARAASK